MAKCTESDLAALREAGPLLRFAAERVKNLDPDLALSIALAQDAADSDQWNPQISQRFWQAFAKLCDLILPATMDSLAAARTSIEPSRWRRLIGAGAESIAARSSRRYLLAMCVLLLFILVIQLYVWTCSNLCKKIDELFVQENTKYATLQQDYIRIDADADNKAPAKWATDRILAESNSIQGALDHINTEACFLKRISTLFIGGRKNDGTCSPQVSMQKTACTAKDCWMQPYEAAGAQLSETKNRVLKVEENANLFVGVFGAYILPVLFGMIGAVAYVIRTISDQIRTSTFATNSPVRHFMRAGLGAMAGLVVGLFSDLSSTLSLSPLAVAFLAGYGVEAVFSMFDGIIGKLKANERQAVEPSAAALTA